MNPLGVGIICLVVGFGLGYGLRVKIGNEIGSLKAWLQNELNAIKGKL